MTNIEDSDKTLSWYRKRLETTEDWNSLPERTKKDLLSKLQQSISALLHFYIGKEELLKLVQLTDIQTVFDACITVLAALPDFEHKNRRQVLAYLTKVVVSTELAQNRQDPEWHNPPPAKRKRGKIATLEFADKYDPYNFKRAPTCKNCGKRIRIDNVTGVCTDCQRWKAR